MQVTNLTSQDVENLEMVPESQHDVVASSSPPFAVDVNFVELIGLLWTYLVCFQARSPLGAEGKNPALLILACSRFARSMLDLRSSRI